MNRDDDVVSLRAALHEAKHDIQHKTASIRKLEKQVQNLEKQLNSSRRTSPSSSVIMSHHNKNGRNGRLSPNPTSLGLISDSESDVDNMSLSRSINNVRISGHTSPSGTLAGGSGKVIGELQRDIQDLKSTLELTKKQVAQERRLKEQALDQLMDARESKDSYRIESENMRIMMERKERGMEEERAKRVRAEAELSELRDYAMISGKRAGEMESKLANTQAQLEQSKIQYEVLRKSAQEDIAQLRKGLEQALNERRRQNERLLQLDTERKMDHSRMEEMQIKYVSLQETFENKFSLEISILRKDLEGSIRASEECRQRTEDAHGDVQRLVSRIRSYKDENDKNK